MRRAARAARSWSSGDIRALVVDCDHCCASPVKPLRRRSIVNPHEGDDEEREDEQRHSWLTQGPGSGFSELLRKGSFQMMSHSDHREIAA